MSALDLGYLVEIRFKAEWGDTFTFLMRAACARLRLTLVVTGHLMLCLGKEATCPWLMTRYPSLIMNLTRSEAVYPTSPLSLMYCCLNTMVKIFLRLLSVIPTVLGTLGPTYLFSTRWLMKASVKSTMETMMVVVCILPRNCICNKTLAKHLLWKPCSTQRLFFFSFFALK